MNLDATVRYLTVTNNKKRYITTYKNNNQGHELRIQHKYFVNYLTETSFDKFNSDFAYAYLKEKSPKKLVEKHLQHNYFLCLDIKSFFESIDLNILKQKANFLVTKNFPQAKLDNLIESCQVPKKDNGLAIGLIPSALFSNIYLQDFDKQLNNFLLKINTNFVYTRYSDDLFISLNTSFDDLVIKKEVIKLLAELGLVIHSDKTRYKEFKTKGDHLKILGLNIVKGEFSNHVSVSRKYKKKFKQERKTNVKKGMNNYITYNQIINML
ncbi:MAG: reverse transcriptase domain-containing protein [Mycoplasmatales bacterium]